MTMVTETLESYYRMMTALQFDHGLSISDIEEMIPWELELYVVLRTQELERRKQEKK